MTKAIFFYVVLIIDSALLSFGQMPGSVRGQVLPYAQKASPTIALLHAKDSLVVEYTVPGKDGFFLFESVPAGRYLVSASAVEHRKIYSAPFILDESLPQIQLPLVTLVAVARAIRGVTVATQSSLIEQKIDPQL